MLSLVLSLLLCLGGMWSEREFIRSLSDQSSTSCFPLGCSQPQEVASASSRPLGKMARMLITILVIIVVMADSSQQQQQPTVAVSSDGSVDHSNDSDVTHAKLPSTFRLGSGAATLLHGTVSEPTRSCTVPAATPAVPYSAVIGRPRLLTADSVEPTDNYLAHKPLTPLFASSTVTLFALAALVGHMLGGRGFGGQGGGQAPGQGGRGASGTADPPGQGNLRTPPAWNPSMESTYPFRDYSRDLMLWSLATDLQPHQQASAAVLRLSGQARDVAREMTPDELVNGGDVNGVHLDPLAFLIRGLQVRFAPLGEETALRSITELMSFNRLASERIDELVSRFETLRHRALAQGGFTMSMPGYAMSLLRACGVNNEQLLQVLAPIGGRLPQNQDELHQMQGYLRRMGHILEAFPNNVAQTLRNHQAPRAPTFFGNDDGGQQQQPQQQQQPASTFGGPTVSGSVGGVPHGASGTWGGGESYPSVEVDSGTDSDTSSDDWHQPVANPFLHLPEGEQEQAIFWQYSQARRLWRRFSQKPNRRV